MNVRTLNLTTEPFYPSKTNKPEKQPSQTFTSDLTRFLLKKDLLLSRLTVFNDKPESFCSWKACFKRIMSELEVNPSEELDLLVKYLGPESSSYAHSIGKDCLRAKKTEFKQNKDSKASQDNHCPLHKTNHSLNNCRAFRLKPLDERRKFIRDNALCFRCCSSTDHKIRDCKEKIVCGECGSDSHPSALHLVKQGNPTNNGEENHTPEVSSICTKGQGANAMAVEQENKKLLEEIELHELVEKNKTLKKKLKRLDLNLKEKRDQTNKMDLQSLRKDEDLKQKITEKQKGLVSKLFISDDSDSDTESEDFLEFGWPVGYSKHEFPETIVRNHKSALFFSEHIDEYINKELSYNALVGPFKVNPFQVPLATSPLSSVPKKDTIERRTIMNLSFPIGTSVNDGIPKHTNMGDPFTLHYLANDHLVQFINEKGPNCLLYKVDIQRCYRWLPVDPYDYHLLGLVWNHKLYFDT
ncbi:unnamed protein product [Mytilus edulis]|uniref:Uncharacterized protein n=1 Tax=Mytilus edulis TaxID=6550 RepID=A0A8S3THP7_MYTED|nr:unnamed protein product [Mytilus edulis]